MEYSRRQDAALTRLQVDVELFCLHFARLAGHHCQHGAAVACYDVVDPELAKPELGEVEIEPAGKGRVHVNDRSIAIGGEKPSRSMVEIVDRVLKILEEAFVAVVLARFVGHRPDRCCMSGDAPKRPHANAVPGHVRLAVKGRGQTEVLGRALTRLGRLRQPVDGFGDVWRSGEQALDRLQFAAQVTAGERAIGLVRIENARFPVGDHDSVGVGVSDGPGCVESDRADRELQPAERKEQQSQSAAKGEHDDHGCHDRQAGAVRSEP